MSLINETLSAWSLAYAQAIEANDSERAAIAYTRYLRTLARASEGGAK